jgi:hypothetical protein
MNFMHNICAARSVAKPKCLSLAVLVITMTILEKRLDLGVIEPRFCRFGKWGKPHLASWKRLLIFPVEILLCPSLVRRADQGSPTD